jgi:hypothetical protein
MKTLLTLLLATLCAATGFGQTIKTLGYNTTNGQVVANTTNALTFTNTSVAFGDISIQSPNILWGGVASINLEEKYLSFEGQEKLRWQEEDVQISVPLTFSGTNTASATRANLGFSTNLNTLWTSTNSSNARSAVGLGATWLTNTNVTNFRTAIGLGATNDVVFGSIETQRLDIQSGTNLYILLDDGIADFNVAASFNHPDGILFTTNTGAAATRTNLGLPLPALTNTSNVTMMQALAGSTNTNHPFSGSFNVTDDNSTTRTIVVSNGIIVSADEY